MQLNMCSTICRSGTELIYGDQNDGAHTDSVPGQQESEIRLGTSALFWSVNHLLESLETIHVVNVACRSERQQRESFCHKSHPLLTPVVIHFFTEEEQFHSVEPGRK